jgi:DNA polymerase-3 subunit epsilon/exodeoxyribonuclease X
MAKYIILDTETTGTGDTDRVIQLGYIVLDGKKVTAYNEFCRSDQPISYGAMEVHGITPELLEGKPECCDTVAFQTLKELNTADNYMIIHNAPFDLAMLEKEGFTCKMKLIDTLRVAKHVLEDEEAHRLQYFRYKMGLYKKEEAEAKALGIVVKAHDAIGDVLVLKLLLSELRKAVEEKFPSLNPVEMMVELTQKPILIKTFRFGKHRGKSVADVAQEDAGYLRWMLSNMENLDDDMRYTLNHYLNP